MSVRRPLPLAVALRYDGKTTPTVTAKGAGHVADGILKVARAHGVPLRESPELAQALATIPLDAEVPPALWIAVAEVLAFAYRVKGKAPQHREPRQPVLPAPRG